VTVLGNVVRDGIAFLQQVNRNSGVRVETDLTEAPVLVRASGAVLRQVVYHLVQNAMDASPPDTTVRLSAHLHDDQLEIRVSDSGPGVPVELRERVFEPFFSTKNKRGGASGLGLGLSLVRRSVALAGGRISVDSGPTGGALFIVTLPPRQGADPI
jgi:signal transduction histidine kinase